MILLFVWNLQFTLCIHNYSDFHTPSLFVYLRNHIVMSDELLQGIQRQLEQLQCSFDGVNDRLRKVESTVGDLSGVSTTNIQSGGAQATRSTDNNASGDTQVTHTDRDRLHLDEINTPASGPTEIRAADLQRDFDRLRDSLNRVPVPEGLKLYDSSTGVKQECRPTLRVISKCARYTEVTLKILSAIKVENGEVRMCAQDLDNLFIGLAAEINFLQAEYANLVVKSAFNENTSRLFRQFENNASSFSPAALQNVRIAAELATAQERTRPTFSSRPRFRPFRGARRGGLARGSFPRFDERSDLSYGGQHPFRSQDSHE